MILHPGILALILGSSIVLLMILYACANGLRILRRWDAGSHSEAQLELERRTYLVSTLTSTALGFQVVSLLLFLYTVEDIHGLFVGAMCATGTLNAAPWGWTVLGVKTLMLFLSLIWIAVHRLDQRAGDFPIVRRKYVALLLLAPLVVTDLALQVAYFGGLDPKVITSCCGALFGDRGSTLAGELAALPPGPMLWAFYGTLGLFMLVGLGCLGRRSDLPRYALSGASLVLLVVSLLSVVSFLSPYIYELPTHHCPFDMIQRQYSFIGYPLYASLFAAVYYGLLPGLLAPLRKIPSLAAPVAAAQARWLVLGLIWAALFAAVASWPVVFGGLTLMGH